MKVVIFENPSGEDTTEFFGLSRAGKSTILKDLQVKTKKVILENNSSLGGKVFFALQFMIFHPVSTLYLFYKLNTTSLPTKHFSKNERFRIWLLRNSYLGAVMAKHSKYARKGLFVDEFFIQSAFMILQNKPSKKECIRVMKHLIRSRCIVLIEISEKERYMRIKETRLPGHQISTAYATLWMKNMERNYVVFKEALFALMNHSEVTSKELWKELTKNI